VRRALVIVALLATLSGAGCIKIPPESIQLNELLRSSLIDTRQKHIELAHKFFESRREQFDEWWLREYEPAYFANYKKIFQTKTGRAYDPNSQSDHQLYVRDSIAEYSEMVSEIGRMEMEMVRALDTRYGDMVRSNEAVSQLLSSAKNLSEAQKQLYNQTLGQAIPQLEADKVDGRIRDLQNKAANAIGLKQ
jgi:hypothetical protein